MPNRKRGHHRRKTDRKRDHAGGPLIGPPKRHVTDRKRHRHRKVSTPMGRRKKMGSKFKTRPLGMTFNIK